MNTQDRIDKALYDLTWRNPYYAALIMRLPIVPSDTAETMETDGRSIEYSPAFVDATDPAELTAVLAHEAGHILSAHHIRKPDGVTDERWNIAADYETNAVLTRADFKLPAKALYAREFDNLSAEEILGQLRDKDDQGEPQPGGVKQAPDPEQAERERKINVVQAAMACAARPGDMPADVAREIETITRPKADWRAILARFVSEPFCDDFSYRRPNRRFVADDVYLPGRDGETMGDLVLMIDTSGSIDAALLAEFAGHMRAAIDDADPQRVVVLYIDTRVQAAEIFERGEHVTIEASGGGGTDFRPGFDWLAEKNITPACAVYFTDLLCNRWPDPQPFPILWASQNPQINVPHGEIVELKR